MILHEYIKSIILNEVSSNLHMHPQYDEILKLLKQYKVTLNDLSEALHIMDIRIKRGTQYYTTPALVAEDEPGFSYETRIAVDTNNIDLNDYFFLFRPKRDKDNNNFIRIKLTKDKFKRLLHIANSYGQFDVMAKAVGEIIKL